MLRRLPEGLLLSLVLLPAAHAQFNSTSTAGCLRLLGSVACEGCTSSSHCLSTRGAMKEEARRNEGRQGRVRRTSSHAPSLSRSPSVEGAYIHPQNLSQAFPWMSTVTNVAEFDTSALEYFSDPAQCASHLGENERAFASSLTYALCFWCAALIQMPGLSSSPS